MVANVRARPPRGTSSACSSRFEAVPFFWSQHYDVAINYVGHAERWDGLDVDGDPSTHDCAVWFRRGDRTYAVATIFRDRESLETEAAMERGGKSWVRRLHGNTASTTIYNELQCTSKVVYEVERQSRRDAWPLPRRAETLY